MVPEPIGRAARRGATWRLVRATVERKTAVRCSKSTDSICWRRLRPCSCTRGNINAKCSGYEAFSGRGKLRRHICRLLRLFGIISRRCTGRTHPSARRSVTRSASPIHSKAGTNRDLPARDGLLRRRDNHKDTETDKPQEAPRHRDSLGFLCVSVPLWPISLWPISLWRISLWRISLCLLNPGWPADHFT